MKYVIIIPDGVADERQDSLNNKTPLELANTPAMDKVAEQGIVGRANNTPAKFDAGSAVASMSLFGYDPLEHFTGRAPIEAAAAEIELGANDWAVRCNLVNVQDQVMKDFTAGHISTEEARQLLKTANTNTDDCMEFVSGVSYRNLLIYRGDESPAPFTSETRTFLPHDLTDQSVADSFPRGPGSEVLTDLMQYSVGWFSDHDVNKKRTASDQSTATNIWLWGQGQSPKLPSFKETHSINGAMITAVDLLRGLGRLIGWEIIEVPGATGYVDTNYAAKGQYAISALEKFDLVCVHVEATDEASHEGDAKKKIAAIESIDQEIVAPIYEELSANHEGWRILITPDHPTFLRTKTHTHGDVPFAICGTGVEPDDSTSYNEIVAGESASVFEEGHKLMPFFIGK